ncbi:MAG: hypothetical protein AAF571_08195 [Verrucomicrobiota bacterium]
MNKVIIWVLFFASVALLPGQTPEKKEIDRSELNELSDKEFSLGGLGGLDMTDKESSLMKKSFMDKESSLFSRKEAPGFGETMPLEISTIQQEFQTKSFTQFDRENMFLKAQQRFDFAQTSPYSTKQLVPESDKASTLDGKTYEGRESVIIKRHLNELQHEQFEKLDLEDAALSVEQIREMLAKE